MVNKIKYSLQSLLTFILLLAASASWAQQLIVKVSSTHLEEGDFLELVITADFQTREKPNLEKLNPDFDVLGSSASTQYRIINGNYSASTQWNIQLLAKKVGELKIPSFNIEGARSEPIKIQVEKASQTKQDYNLSFLEAKVDQANPYIQAEVIYTLRFYHQGQLQVGSVDQPKFDKFISERLSNQNTFQRQLNGKTYRVYEWVYALYPQESGEIIIPQQTFEGTIYANQQMIQTEQKSEEIRLNVRAIPQDYPQDAKWLPAKNLSLQDKWIKPQVIEENAAIERQITLSAQGLKASQLPRFSEGNHQNYKIYNEAPLPRERVQDRSISSQQIQKQMYLMHTPGTIKLDALEVYWWNTQTDKLELAKIDAQEIPVGAGVETQTDPQAQQDEDASSAAKKDFTSSSINYWQYLALAFALIWLATILVMLKRKTLARKISTETTSQAEINSETQQQVAPTTLEQTDQSYYLSVQKQLKDIYQVESWQELKDLEKLKGLEELAGLDQSNSLHPYPELKEALKQLEAQIFKDEKPLTQEDKDRIQKLLNQVKPKIERSSSAKKLADLYP